MQNRLDQPPTHTHQVAGLCNLINHEINQWIGPIYTNWIGPLGTHSARKGLLDFAYILSTPGHAFKEKISTWAHVPMQTLVLFLCKEKFMDVPTNGMRKFPSAKDPF